MSPSGDSRLSGLPGWAVVALGLQAGKEHRESYLGDMEEAYRLRTARSGGPETGWLVLQVLGGCLPWLRTHLDSAPGAWRSVAWNVVALAAAAMTLALWFSFFNYPPVLEFIRSLPAPLRLPLAGLLNLMAAASAGGVVGWLRSGMATVGWGALGIGAWVGMLAGPGAPDPGALLWAATLCAAAFLGWGAARWTHQASTGALSPQP